jgi:hypothetical protein
MKNNLKTLLGYLLEEETAKSRHLFENGVSGAKIYGITPHQERMRRRSFVEDCV